MRTPGNLEYGLLGSIYTLRRISVDADKKSESGNVVEPLTINQLLGITDGRGWLFGYTKGTQSTIVLVATKWFGSPPSRAQQAALDAITDIEHLERMAEHLVAAVYWADLLATP
jgi:hypothetical protein